MYLLFLLLVPIIWSITNVLMKLSSTSPITKKKRLTYVLWQLINWIGTIAFHYCLSNHEYSLLLVTLVANGGTLILTSIGEQIIGRRFGIQFQMGLILFVVGMAICLSQRIES